MRRPGGEPPRAGRPGGQASRSTATGPHHGAMRRDGARWRRRGRGAIIKRRWTLRGQTPRPARLWGAHGDAPSKTLSVCYLPSHAPRWRGGGGTGVEDARGAGERIAKPRTAPRRGGAMGTSRPTATGPHHGGGRCGAAVGHGKGCVRQRGAGGRVARWRGGYCRGGGNATRRERLDDAARQFLRESV